MCYNGYVGINIQSFTTKKEENIPMAFIEIVPFGTRLNLHLINSWIVVSSEDKIGDIQKWLDEIEHIEENIATAFTPKAMVEYYNIPECFMTHTQKLAVGGSFTYNGYTVKKITEHLCAVVENK